MKLCYLDFEFNNIREAKLNLVSVSFQCQEDGEVKAEKTLWLYRDPQTKAKAAAYFRKIHLAGYTFVAYVAEAEIRSLISLGFTQKEVLDLKVIDLYLEYRCLLNHNHKLAYGKQYIKGQVIETKPPKSKWEAKKDDDLHHRPEYSLAAACYKLLGEKVDTVEKNEVRDLIISDSENSLIAQKYRILKYNRSDIDLLPRLIRQMVAEFRSVGVWPSNWLKGAKARGMYSACNALMVTKGYPVNMGKISKFTANLPNILKAAQEEANQYGVDAFRWVKKSERYVATQNKIREWVAAQGFPYWRKTDKGQLSLSMDAFSDHFDSKSDGFGGAYYRYLKIKQSLNGFSLTESKKGKFTDFVGRDSRVRPNFGIYGSQSGRSQPGAVGFIPLKSHWMRNFIEARPGRAICEIDYSGQEFLLAAVLSRDPKMLQAYETGDPYTAFGIQAGILPKGATKKSHPEIRDRLKTVVLGVSYNMGPKVLAYRLKCEELEAEGLIDKFYTTYSNYSAWKDETAREYRDFGYLHTTDYWYMFGDNPNIKSVLNFPIQAKGAEIMRDAVRRCYLNNINVIFTLHDALYIEFESQRLDRITALMAYMQEAYHASFRGLPGIGKVPDIRLEGYCWSKDYERNTPSLPNVSFMSEYIDDKGREDYERYKQFFT